MTHDWSHLDDAASIAIRDIYDADNDGILLNKMECARHARCAILSAITPSDLAALLAVKCPGWQCVPIKPTKAMRNKWIESAKAGLGDEDYEEWKTEAWDRASGYAAGLSAAPKLGEDN